MTRFADRAAAGRLLAARLRDRHDPDPVVLALPRGGVPVAAEVARALGAPLDLVMVRKIGLPSQPELALGAVVDGAAPHIVINDQVARMAGFDRAAIARLAQPELAEILRRREVYLAGRAPVALKGRSVIVVDDGIATGATMRASLQAVRASGPGRLILAVPVAPADTVTALAAEVDATVVLAMPDPFIAVGAHYTAFPQTTDAEVVALLSAAAARLAGD